MTNKLLFITIAVLLVLTIGCSQKEESPRTEKIVKDVETKVIKVIDPVCGMSISKSGKFLHKHEVETYHFCSAACLEKFEKEPEKYLKNK